MELPSINLLSGPSCHCASDYILPEKYLMSSVSSSSTSSKSPSASFFGEIRAVADDADDEDEEEVDEEVVGQPPMYFIPLL